MKKYIIALTVVEEKALLTSVVSIQEWIDNIIHNKARQCIDRVCQEVLDDHTHIILPAQKKKQVVAQLAQAGLIINTVKGLPSATKDFIVTEANILSAFERSQKAEE